MTLPSRSYRRRSPYDPERAARFEREAQLLAALNHPHIAGIYGLGQADGSQFLVMELVEGETLAEKLAGGAIPADEAIRIAGQIADALQAAHDKGIIHRDLKPANIALTTDGQVKVLDFGLAKAIEGGSGIGDPGSAERADSPTLTLAATQAGVILGTAAYMAPEQAKGKSADKRSDLWSFGCVLYEMLTGRRTFDGDDASDTMAAVLRAEPDWNALPTGVPPAIRLLLRRCLEKDRRARIVDAGAALFVLRELSAPASPSVQPAAVTRSSWRRNAAYAVAVLVLMVGAALGRLEVTTWPPSATRFAVAPSGVDVRWSRKGDALFYLNNRTGELMGVDVTPGTPPRFGTPKRIYAGPLDFFTIHSFDVTPAGDRFIVHTPDPGGEITVLLNWPSLLQ